MNDMIYQMKRGLKLNYYYLGARGLGAAMLVIIGDSLMRYSGFCALEPRAEICRRAMVTEKIHIDASVAGVIKVFGKDCCSN